MFVSKCFFSVVILLVVHETLSKPTESALTQGRSIGSTLWGWIKYPFTWLWSESEPTPINDHLIATTTYGPNDDIELGKHNVTVWCNEQTCTTMKCNENGCKNNTCNIYDTYPDGECREYNTIVDPDKPMTQQEVTTSLNSPQNVITTNVTPKIESESKPAVPTQPNIQEEEPLIERKDNVIEIKTKAPIEHIETTSGPYNKVTEIPTSVEGIVRERATTIKDDEESSVRTSQ